LKAVGSAIYSAMAETTDINLGCMNGPIGNKEKYRNGSNGYQRE